jgi:hypothetical protein
MADKPLLQLRKVIKNIYLNSVNNISVTLQRCYGYWLHSVHIIVCHPLRYSLIGPFPYSLSFSLYFFVFLSIKETVSKSVLECFQNSLFFWNSVEVFLLPYIYCKELIYTLHRTNLPESRSRGILRYNWLSASLLHKDL